MKLPSSTEKKILDEVGDMWLSGSELKIQYVKKHGEISNGSFYTMLRRLGEAGWVESRAASVQRSEDKRQRYYGATRQTQQLKGKLNDLYQAMKSFKKELKR